MPKPSTLTVFIDDHVIGFASNTPGSQTFRAGEAAPVCGIGTALPQDIRRAASTRRIAVEGFTLTNDGKQRLGVPPKLIAALLAENRCNLFDPYLQQTYINYLAVEFNPYEPDRWPILFEVDDVLGPNGISIFQQ
jgi:hypothetical protein